MSTDLTLASRMRQLAAARRDYATSGPEDARLIIAHEAAVMDALADLLDGTRTWDEIVDIYAPSRHWRALRIDDLATSEVPQSMTNRPPASGGPLLDYPQAANRLGIKEDHLRKLTYRRLIPFIKLPPGGRTAKVRFDPADLDTWINAHKVPVINLGDPLDAGGDPVEHGTGNDRPKARQRLRELLDPKAPDMPRAAARAG